MVRSLKYLFICLGFLLISSCAKDDDNEDVSVTQTVFVFFPYAENLTTNSSYLPGDLSEIKEALRTSGGTNGYRVIVYRGSSATAGEIFELQLANGVVKENKLQSYSNIDQTSEDCLTEIFSYIKNNTHTSSYKMIIGGHGCGWLPAEINYGAIRAPKKSFGGANAANTRINISTLANAMNRATLCPDLLIIDACSMANIETVWALQSSAKYIITPPSEQAAAGFPYTDIWPNIIAEATLDNLKSLCNKYVQYYENRHSGFNTPDGISASPANATIIDCSALQGLDVIMKAINADAVAAKNIASQMNNTASKSAIQRYDMKSTGIFYDLQSYAYAILQPETYAQGATLYNNFVSVLNSAVPYFAHSGYFLANGNLLYKISSANTCGLATSDPSTNASITAYKQTTTWWKATH